MGVRSLLLVIFVVAVRTAILPPPAPPIWCGLKVGPHGAGTATVTRGNVVATMWYPSSGDGKPITVGHFAASVSSFADEAGVGGLPADIISRYASRQLFARADAPGAPGKFPLVVIAQGNQQRPLHQAVLAEFLSSHGFVVATAASTTVATPMRTADDVGPAAQREA